MMMQQSLDGYHSHGVRISGGESHLVLGDKDLYGKIIIVLDKKHELHLFGVLRNELCAFLPTDASDLLTAVKSGMTSYNLDFYALSHEQVYVSMMSLHPTLDLQDNSRVVGGAAAFYRASSRSLYINDSSGKYQSLLRDDLNLCLREQQSQGLQVFFGEDVKTAP